MSTSNLSLAFELVVRLEELTFKAAGVRTSDGSGGSCPADDRWKSFHQHIFNGQIFFLQDD